MPRRRRVRNAHFARNTMRRIAWKGGVARVGPDVLDQASELVRGFAQAITRDASILASHNKRKRINLGDILYSLKKVNLGYLSAKPVEDWVEKVD